MIRWRNKTEEKRVESGYSGYRTVDGSVMFLHVYQKTRGGVIEFVVVIAW